MTEYEEAITAIEYQILPLVPYLNDPLKYEVALEIIEDELKKSHLPLEEKEDVILYFDEEYGIVPKFLEDNDV